MFLFLVRVNVFLLAPNFKELVLELKVDLSVVQENVIHLYKFVIGTI